MKLVDQTILAYRAGSNEKVYEIDLCEVGPNRFVVNYRYGRRGKPLKDGTRTVAPVPEDDARRIYAKLVDSKTSAGYAPSQAHVAAPTPPPSAAPTPVAAAAPTAPTAAPTQHRRIVVPQVSGDLQRAVLARIAAGDSAATPSAAPDPEHPSMMDRMRHLAFRRPTRTTRRSPADKRWTLNRAIWRAGQLRLKEAATLLPSLVGTGDTVRDHSLAFAMGRTGDPSVVPALQTLRSHRAPHVARMATAALLDLLPKGEADVLKAEVLAKHPDALSWVYLAGERNTVVEAVATLPLTPPHFRELRAVFKLAEYRCDGQIFGLLAYRFALTPAMFDNAGGGASVPDRSGIRRTRMGENQLQSMLSSDNATAAYGSKTRWYLRQRVWRSLNQLGKDADPKFVPMAVGVLAPFSDTDAGGGNFTQYWAFNHILYTAGNRVRRTKRSFWARQPNATQREEKYRELWDGQPRAVLHLISASECRPVHDFAVRVLRDNPGFCATIPVPALAMMLDRPYDSTVQLAFDLAQQRFVPGGDQRELTALAFAVANCAKADIRARGFQWIESTPAWFLSDPEGLARLVVSPHADARAFARRLLDGRTIDASVAGDLVTAVVDAILGLDEDQAERAREAGDTLRLTLGSALGRVTSAQVLALLGSELEAARLLGAHLLKGLDDAALLAEESRLWGLLTHRDESLRAAVRPTVAGLCSRQQAYAGKLLQMMLAAILRRLLPEGVPGFLVRFIRADLSGLLATVPEAIVWRLVRSKEAAAQELGGVLLPHHLDPQTVPIQEVIELASHQILSLREASWKAYERMVPRLKGEMAVAVGMLEATWEDSRLFAFNFFETHFDKDDFTPDVLVSICDSVRPDVQAYGRRMITRHFDEAHGEQYLLQLSEHPADDVQLFATNYLQRYAAGHTDNLEKLEHYFVRILSAVNRGRVAKQRTHAFLRQEALRSEDAATVVSRILTRQSASDAVEERAEALVTMAAIHRMFPTIPVPFTFEPFEMRGSS